MTRWLDWITWLLNVWAIRVLVLSSFALHVVLILFAGIHRRKATGVRRDILWLAYQPADWAATYALGNLSLGSTSLEQQLVAFWASFLLLHLGGPDNISAYSLEDNVLSGRQVLQVVAQVAGASVVLYKHIYIGGGGGTLLPAAFIMFAVGVAKYVERALALWRGDLGSIRSSLKKQQPRSFSTNPLGGRELDDEQALLVAHGLFHISKGAFADYSVVKDESRKIFSYGWKDMCKVVEMELSLMYDILYTKAAMVHTWGGYLLRFVSPPFTAAVFLLFWFYSKDGQRRIDVIITYTLLVSTFFLDMRWLLGALGSTWTYAFLSDRCWLHHQLLCSGRWHRLRRFIVSLDTRRLLGKEPAASYRLWSGTIGQYNLLHECTHDTASLRSRLGKKVASQDRWMEYQYHYSGGIDISKGDVKDLLFERIREELKKAYPVELEAPPAPPPPPPTPPPPAFTPQLLELAAADLRRIRELDEALGFDPVYGERILIWHIATDVFLLCSDQNAASPTDVKAIKALSDYMVFLVAVCPYMLPGLKLRSTYEATRDALEKIWDKKLENKRESPQSSRDLRESSSSSKIREEELASILRNMEKKPGSKLWKPRNRKLPAVACRK